MTSPPPIPSMPAKKPVNKPSPIYANHQLTGFSLQAGL
jgi:hypothetical protein